jgi:hypothetical protein
MSFSYILTVPQTFLCFKFIHFLYLTPASSSYTPTYATKSILKFQPDQMEKAKSSFEYQLMMPFLPRSSSGTVLHEQCCLIHPISLLLSHFPIYFTFSSTLISCLIDGWPVDRFCWQYQRNATIADAFGTKSTALTAVYLLTNPYRIAVVNYNNTYEL